MSKYFILALVCVAVLSAPVFATDHIDTPFEKAKVTDITDLFAFSQLSEGKNKLVVALCVELFAKKKTLFAENVEYSFHIRRAMLDGFGRSFKIQTGEEFQFSCNFINNREGEQDVNCVVYNGNQQEIARANSTLNNTSGGTNPSVRLFAGHRADPFFFDAIRVGMKRKRDTSFNDKGFPFPGILPKNGLFMANVLTIVIEIDTDAVFGVSDNSLFAVAAHTKMETFQGGARTMMNIDRVGRPEVTNFIMGKFSVTDDELNKVKKEWNAEETFALSAQKTQLYRETIEAGLKNMDLKDPGAGTDGLDWTYPHPFTDIIMQDFLLVDVSKSGNVDSSNFLEIELARVLGRDHVSSGGRTPNEDFVDTMLTLFINGPERKAPIRGDGIDKQTRSATNVFPYLANPH